MVTISIGDCGSPCVLAHHRAPVLSDRLGLASRQLAVIEASADQAKYSQLVDTILAATEG